MLRLRQQKERKEETLAVWPGAHRQARCARREEAHPRLEELGLSSQSHLGLPGGKVTFSWELEGQEQSC